MGGTKILSALFTAGGNILGIPVETPTPAVARPEAIIEAIAHNFLGTVQNNDAGFEKIVCLGVGVPTTFSYDYGLLDPSPNLPTLIDYPLARELTNRLGLPVAMEKDANCFLLGEMTHGAAHGCNNCCGLTIGTGLGLGMTIDGRLVRGADFCAGEIWTSPYRDGILEDRVSGRAIAERYFAESSIRPPAGKNLAGWWPRWSGTRGSFSSGWV